jgi:hypothetical protein
MPLVHTMMIMNGQSLQKSLKSKRSLMLKDADRGKREIYGR